MKRELLNKWIDALRSGEYEQGNGVLCLESATEPEKLFHCCLGVLCEVAGLNREVICDGEFVSNVDVSTINGGEHVTHEAGPPYLNPDRDGYLHYYSLNPACRGDEVLPEDFRSDQGISLSMQQTLTEMNDAGYASFDDIADMLEQAVIADDDIAGSIWDTRVKT